MDLNELLKKTKSKSDKITHQRKSVFIDDGARPYDEFESEEVNVTGSKKSILNKREAEIVPINVKQVPRYEPKFIPIRNLSPLQKKLVTIIENQCISTNSDTTPLLHSDFLVYKTKSTTVSIRKTLQRLEKAGVIIRKEYKNGRGGGTSYSIADNDNN